MKSIHKSIGGGMQLEISTHTHTHTVRGEYTRHPMREVIASHTPTHIRIHTYMRTHTHAYIGSGSPLALACVSITCNSRGKLYA